jgi:hypothetical protein
VPLRLTTTGPVHHVRRAPGRRRHVAQDVRHLRRRRA